MNAPIAVEPVEEGPYDIEAEQALLGAILVDPPVLARLSIGPQHFYDQLHARIFETIARKVEHEGGKISPVGLHAAMKTDPGLTEVGGREFLMGLYQAAPAHAPVEDYAAIIIDNYFRRCGSEIADRVKAGIITAEETAAAFAELADQRAARDAGAQDCLAAADWLKRDIPAPDLLLGHFLSTTSRCLLAAPTGLGKTNLVVAMAFGTASGQGFLHWRSSRPARVLIVDGEMSRRLFKSRLADAARRHGGEAPATLFAICRDDVPDMPPLNTIQGQAFIDRKIKQIGGADLIFFDNVMSLINGEMIEEEPWRQTMPWIKRLTQRSIGQMWVHHTGVDKSRSYGTNTREWQMDTVMLLEAAERPGSDIAFSVKFTKARERTPDNRADFAPAVITLAQDRWDVELMDATPAKPIKAPSPKAKAFHVALVEALSRVGEVRPVSHGQFSVTMEQWETEAQRRGLIDKDATASQRRALMSKYRLELVASGMVNCADKIAWNRTVAL